LLLLARVVAVAKAHPGGMKISEFLFEKSN